MAVRTSARSLSLTHGVLGALVATSSKVDEGGWRLQNEGPSLSNTCDPLIINIKCCGAHRGTAGAAWCRSQPHVAGKLHQLGQVSAWHPRQAPEGSNWGNGPGQWRGSPGAGCPSLCSKTYHCHGHLATWGDDEGGNRYQPNPHVLRGYLLGLLILF